MKLCTLVIAAALIATTAASLAQGAPMNEVNQLVQALVTQNAKPAETALDEQNIAASPQFVQLKGLCQTHWSSILDNLGSVVGGDAGKSMTISAFEGLAAADYMTTLERLAEKFRQSQISKPVMSAALRSTGRMQAFLPDNYQHARVQALLNDLKPRFAGDSAMQAAITDILSGKTKTDTDNFREAHQDSAEGNIPRVLLTP
jgi:hypothetical protein